MAIGTAAAIIGGSVLGAAATSNAAKKAAKAQTQAAESANDTQLAMFNQSRADQEPWRKTGETSLNELARRLGLNGGSGDLMRSFGASDFQADPGYQFRRDEGWRGVENTAAAKGGLLSGAALKAASRYNQDFASNEFGNAFNRFQTNQTNQFNRLASLAGVGQTAANQNSNSAMQTGRDIGNNITGAGNARASGYVGTANALTNGVSQGMNWWQQNQLLDKIGNKGDWWNSVDGINANGGGF